MLEDRYKEFCLFKFGDWNAVQGDIEKRVPGILFVSKALRCCFLSEIIFTKLGKGYVYDMSRKSLLRNLCFLFVQINVLYLCVCVVGGVCLYVRVCLNGYVVVLFCVCACLILFHNNSCEICLRRPRK